MQGGGWRAAVGRFRACGSGLRVYDLEFRVCSWAFGFRIRGLPGASISFRASMHGDEIIQIVAKSLFVVAKSLLLLLLLCPGVAEFMSLILIAACV